MCWLSIKYGNKINFFLGHFRLFSYWLVFLF
nr:MAG TPA: hypothetical protein [Caudoviricetes sp.]